jgi:hypothetical protein
MTWVWKKYNEESSSRASFHARQNSLFTRPWFGQSCSLAVRRGCWPKGRRTNCSYLRERFSEQYATRKSKMVSTRQTNCMTRMISRDYHFRYHSAYYIVYHRFLPKTYTKLFSIKGCCFCCCCFQCNFPYLIVGIRAWFAGYRRRYNHELDKEFESPNALNVTKTSRLRYAGHMIRRPEDLPQKALFRTKPIAATYQFDCNCDSV